MDPEFEKLVNSLLENPRDGEILQALGARLEASPAECQDFLDHCRLHSDLYFLVRSDGAEQRALDDLGAAVLVPSSERQVHHSDRSSRLRNHKGLLGLLAMAASLAIVVGWYFYSFRWQYQEGLRQPTIVATIVSTEEPVWNDGRVEPGQSLRVGSQLHLQAGLVKINMPTGAELLLQGPCNVLLKAPDRVQLREGRLTAHVAEWASGFAVETSSLKVVDLGTQFAVEADSNGNTEAHVLEGHVRIQPFAEMDKSRTSFLLGEGQAIRVNPLQKTTTRLAAQTERFIAEPGEFRPYRPIELHNTGQHLEVGDEDPHWRIVDGAIGAGYQGPQYAVVCEPDERYLSNRPEVSQWMSVAKDVRPGCLPYASYTFQTEFDLTGYDLSSVMILADILADNGVKAVRINGAPVDLVPWRDNEYLQEFRRYRRAEIVSGFKPGKNSIEIDVWNGVYHFDSDTKKSVPTPNPMSIRVEWQAFGIPLTENTRGDNTI